MAIGVGGATGVKSEISAVLSSTLVPVGVALGSTVGAAPSGGVPPSSPPLIGITGVPVGVGRGVSVGVAVCVDVGLGVGGMGVGVG